MKILYVIQRYGRDIAGGAEFACRELAQRLVARGNTVEVLTSCSRSYVTWENSYAAGTYDDGGVTVHRLPVKHERNEFLFQPIDGRVAWGIRPVALHLQREWMRMQGPVLKGLEPWLAERATSFDMVGAITYLYNTTWETVRHSSGRTTTILHPLAHDEPTLHLGIFDLMFRMPQGIVYLSEEEAALVSRRFRLRIPSAVVGLGTDIATPADPSLFKSRFNLESPYLLCVGRVDPVKGTQELIDLFKAYRARNSKKLKLVLMGEGVREVGSDPNVIVTGFQDDDVRNSAMAGALALVHPSYFESFSLVLMEAWMQGIPVIVQRNNPVLSGHVARSGGGLMFSDFFDFEAAVDLVVSNETLAGSMGARGRGYVLENYTWEAVMERYESFLHLVVPH